MDVTFLIVRTADGVVTDAAVGTPGAPEGFEAVERQGAAAAAWIGWQRQPGGLFAPPSQPVDLAAYARERSYAFEIRGIDVGGMAVETTRTSQGLISRAVALLDADPTQTTVEFDAGTPQTLTAAEVKAVGVAVGRHVQDAFARRATALRGIAGGTISTVAAVDAVFA